MKDIIFKNKKVDFDEMLKYLQAYDYIEELDEILKSDNEYFVYKVWLEAAEEGNNELIKELIDVGMNVNIKNNEWTALMIACERCHESVVRLLLENGANVNDKDNNEWTSLMVACVVGHENICHLLLDYGANVNDKNKNGYTALMRACEGGYESVVRLLIENKVDINDIDNNGFTALMLSCQEGHENIVHLLIENGADVDMKNNYGKSALVLAISKEIIEILENYRSSKFVLK